MTHKRRQKPRGKPSVQRLIIGDAISQVEGGYPIEGPSSSVNKMYPAMIGRGDVKLRTT
jgi:hypothetical protein